MLITKQQPIATDLRMMMAALKFLLTLKEWGQCCKHRTYTFKSED